jgi:hypothetical protein
MSTILCLIAGLMIFICCCLPAYIYEEEDVTECSGAIDYVPASGARQPLRRLHGELAAMKARAEKAEADTLRLDWLQKNGHFGYKAGTVWSDYFSVDLRGGEKTTLRDAIDASMKEASN